MATIPSYERDPYLMRCTARAVTSGASVVLDDTVLYPEGGGQPNDHGTVAGIAVTDVRHVADGWRHALAAPLDVAPGTEVEVVLDWARRFDHMQQHTGQHLLSALAEDRFGWATTAFHLGARRSDVELAVAALDAAQRDALEEVIAEAIRAARPVAARRFSVDDFARLEGVRSRGLPDGHAGDVRLVEIDGIDRNTCGGTHLRSTAEIETLVLLDSEPMRGGTRVHFAAGGRVRRLMAEHEARAAQLRAALGAPDEALVAAAGERVAALVAAERRARRAEEELAAALGAALGRDAAPLAEIHLGGRDAAFAQLVAKHAAVAAPAGLAFVSAEAGEGLAFVLVAGEAFAGDVAALGRAAAAALGARGGGSGRQFQGKAPAGAARDAALAALRGLVE